MLLDLTRLVSNRIECGMDVIATARTEALKLGRATGEPNGRMTAWRRQSWVSMMLVAG